MSQMLVTQAGEIVIADIAPPPEDHPATTETPPPAPIHAEPISAVGLGAIAIAVFVLVFIGLKLHSNAKKQ